MEEAESFLEQLPGKRVRRDVEDMVLWTETKSGKFPVKSLYYALKATTLIFFQVVFGMCGCSPRLASLLGRLCEAKL